MADTMDARIGFAGLGAMGYGMASNLIQKGVPVTGFDVSPVALTRFARTGGSVAMTIPEASRDRGMFFVMVATPEQTDSLVFSDDGLAATLPQRAILCLLSTLPPNYVVELPGRLAKNGRGDIRVLDCPVSGGVVGAMGGSLSVRFVYRRLQMEYGILTRIFRS